MSQTILIVDDEPTLRFALSEILKSKGRIILEAGDGAEGLRMICEEDPDLVFLDNRMPEMTGMEVLAKARESGFKGQVILLTAFGEVADAVRAMKLGAFEFLTKPIKKDEIRLLVKSALGTEKLRQENRLLSARQDSDDPFHGFIGKSERMETLFEKIRKVGASKAATVLIQGESGSGKELVARAIHRATGDATGSVVEINCAAIPETLLESELFGHEKGAFTDAKSRKKGLIELAEGGTLFLDEIGEMGLQLQSRLLRVLENRSFRRVGGVEDLEVKARIVAATNKDLLKESEGGRFRSDLYYRLNVIVLDVPPLRQRPEDIPLLAEFFIDRFAQEMGKQVAPLDNEAKDLLAAYHWPGNIRELKNLMERILLLDADDRILPSHLQAALRGKTGSDSASSGEYRPESLSIVELRHIRSTLEHTGGNKSRAAAILGISRQTLREKLKQGDARLEAVEEGSG